MTLEMSDQPVDKWDRLASFLLQRLDLSFHTRQGRTRSIAAALRRAWNEGYELGIHEAKRRPALEADSTK